MAAQTMTMENNEDISLVDNTSPSQPQELRVFQTASSSAPSSFTKRLTRSSVRSELAKRKYAKWQPDKLGVQDNNAPTGSASRSSIISPTQSKNRPGETSSEPLDQQPTDIAALNSIPTQTIGREDANDSSVASELDILYENQRGWFFFGVPFYSHRSLLQFDPPAWVNGDYKPSLVDVTNAQVPDPSWEWTWQSWYVDMSDDVDEEGWQYSFSFASKFGWHGTHPWFHSNVRRRRWVRLRVKRKYARRWTEAEQTGLEMAHRLNEDYFTIHSQTLLSKDPSITAPTGAPAAYTGPRGTAPPEEPLVDEVEDIPTLMMALKLAMVDRERLEALKKFIRRGGEELYYLEENIPHILSLFVFQTSRWQFFKYLQDVVQQACQESNESEGGQKGTDTERRRDSLVRAADAVNRQISGYEVFDVTKEDEQGSLIGMRGRPDMSQPGSTPSISDRLGEIKGIPKAAGIGKEGHIY